MNPEFIGGICVIIFPFTRYFIQLPYVYTHKSLLANKKNHPDKILSRLCRFLVERKLLKVKLQAEPFDNSFIKARKKDAMEKLQLSNEEADYFVFTGEAINTTYNTKDERINILFKDGTVKDISQVDNALIHQHLSATVKKHYICYTRF